jgi:ferrochelatase
MAYGTPETADDVAPYFTHIRGGKAPGAEAVQRLQSRYAIVGGRTPLLEITNAVRDALARMIGMRVYVGMKHWHPFIGDVLPRIADDGVTSLIALALAPHYSRISIGGYAKAVEDALKALPRPMTLRFVENWHLHPRFIELIAGRVRESMAQWPETSRAQVFTVFSAHSLPTRIREWGDPYEKQLLASCQAVVEHAGIDCWRFAFQSAGETGEPWLEPDICHVLETLHAEGARDVLSVPIGFVSDHLEILYDIDYEAKNKANALGMTLRRTRMPNADPAFVRLLASIVAEQSAAAALAS